MRKSISRASRLTYKHLIKPALFKRTPDDVHEKMIATGSRLMKLPLAKHLPQIVAYQNTSFLTQEIGGVTFQNPVGLSAGLDKNAEIVPLVRSIGFGFATIGSITAEVCPGNPRPWFHRLPEQKSLVVHVGLANHGVAKTHERLKSYKDSLFANFPVIASVAKTNSPKTCTDDEAILDYVTSLRHLAKEPKVQIFELNVSCPNTYGGEPFTTPARLDKLLAAVDEVKTTKPIWVKMPINLAWPEFEALLAVIVKHRVAAVTIGNLNKDRSAVPTEELPSKINGNLSGKPTEKLSNDLIAQTYRTYGDQLTIIGVGGIFSARDAYRKICLGASLVELITGMIFEGPQLIGQINRDVVKLLKADGFKNVTEAIGSQNRAQK
ncbi:MAG: quinone-dependent dihydroorotate dehydrogenase [Candidatus Saccharimonadales bacterium]